MIRNTVTMLREMSYEFYVYEVFLIFVSFGNTFSHQKNNIFVSNYFIYISLMFKRKRVGKFGRNMLFKKCVECGKSVSYFLSYSISNMPLYIEEIIKMIHKNCYSITLFIQQPTNRESSLGQIHGCRAKQHSQGLFPPFFMTGVQFIYFYNRNR